jgi:CheY-like chemotaxis protein
MSEQPPAPTVIVLNDDADTVEILVLTIEAAGYLAEGFTNPNAAIERLLALLPPCILLVDRDVGAVSGVDIVRLARAAGLIDLSIVVLTGANPQAIRGELLPLGVTRILKKPLPAEELAAAIAEATARPGSGTA